MSNMVMWRRLTWILTTLLLASSYARAWLEYSSTLWGQKPFIFRHFVFWSAALLIWFVGLDAPRAIALVVILCILGFAAALRYLYGSYHG